MVSSRKHGAVISSEVEFVEAVEVTESERAEGQSKWSDVDRHVQ